ncbi:MAG TPA: ferredoxin [Alphaproteobacteria bacterium]|nr:ferredoxin [Alphaproteobacteria bacterium]
MTRLRIELNTDRCQAFAKCTTTAPAVFALGPDRKIAIVDAAGADDETIVRAAKSCPYRVIALFDAESGAPVFPPGRKLRPQG